MPLSKLNPGPISQTLLQSICALTRLDPTLNYLHPGTVLELDMVSQYKALANWYRKGSAEDIRPLERRVTNNYLIVGESLFDFTHRMHRLRLNGHLYLRRLRSTDPVDHLIFCETNEIYI